MRVPVSIFMVELPLQSIGRGLLEGFLEFVSNFIEASKKVKIKYHNSKLFKIFIAISTHTKVCTDLVLKSFKKYSSRDTIPLM